MSQINVIFENAPVLEILLNNNKSTQIFTDLFKSNLNKSLPIFRDPAKYTLDYLKKLSLEVKKALNWHWMSDNYSIENTVEFHKLIENFLNKEPRKSWLPKKFHQLLHETHFCIHAVQFKNDQWPHGTDIQLEWFNNNYKNLTTDAEFKVNPEFGDVFMQNPYVGHGPLMCYLQNDFQNIKRTCTFHDRIKPGFRINLTSGNQSTFNWEKYEEWWWKNCNEFVLEKGIDNIKKYTGTPILGKIKNKDVLSEVIQIDVLNIKNVELLDY